MASKAPVYIAGGGYSSPTSAEISSQRKDTETTFISAATKALLDAGITFDDVTHGFSSGHACDVFKKFGMTDIPLKEAESASALHSAASLIRENGGKCVLLVGLNKSGGATALILISEAFLWRRPYLNDSSAVIQERESSKINMPKLEPTELSDLCKSVWALRGWSQSQKNTGNERHFHRLRQQDGYLTVFELRRADNQTVPEWKNVEHKQDGKHRLGYNPMVETREIAFEDWLAVKSSRKSAQKGLSRVGRLFKRKGGDRAALARL